MYRQARYSLRQELRDVGGGFVLVKADLFGQLHFPSWAGRQGRRPLCPDHDRLEPPPAIEHTFVIGGKINYCYWKVSLRKVLPLLLLVGLLIGSFAAAPATAKPKKLPMGEALMQAESVMGSYAVKRDDIGWPENILCSRKSRVRMRCAGVAVGETSEQTTRCDLIAVVVNRKVRYNYYSTWEAKPRLTSKRCKVTPMPSPPAPPVLEEPAAREAILTAGKKTFGTESVVIEWLYRSDDTLFEGMVMWHLGPNLWTGQDCDADVDAQLLTDKSIDVKFGGSYCYPTTPPF